ncbi:hypothetical protein RFF05_07995 [Bengtsoniella intestinalis]|uniref:hypothetical protein n=1 Tax=Bengtsoniella intestinalis TaxID=3073143 RepID=UPI00391F95D3
MKTTYIPKGETVTYETLNTEHLVVNGKLEVSGDISASRISGHGSIFATRITADSIVADDVDCATLVCEKLMAKRVTAMEVYASHSAVVSCLLIASYVATSTLTVTLSDCDEVCADRIINLKSKHGGMFWLMVRSALKGAWLSFITPAPKPEVMDAEYTVVNDDAVVEEPQAETAPSEETATEDVPDAPEEAPSSEEIPAVDAEAMRVMIAETVRAVLNERDIADAKDFELQRMASMFKFCRNEGYTLKVVPGTPEENAPVFQPTLKTVA